jgi:hypothetical protein
MIAWIKKLFEKHIYKPEERLIIGTPLYLDLADGRQAIRELGAACYEIWVIVDKPRCKGATLMERARCELRKDVLDGKWLLIDDPETYKLTHVYYSSSSNMLDELVIARNKIEE